MSKKTLFVGLVILILLVISGCTKNKFKLTRSQATDIPYYNPINDTCFICHNVSNLKKTIATSPVEEVVPLYVNRDKFARSLHRGQNCQDCHTDIVLHKGHPDVPKNYGGWANFSAEDTLLTRNYTTQASIACPKCHGRSSFLNSQHYLIGKITASHSESFNGIQIGRDYDKAKCGKCHLTCATCHFKGQVQRSATGEVTDYWSQLLSGTQIANADSLTNWWIDWTTNVESHDFNIAEDLTSSNDMCRVCHTGYYSQYGLKGYPDSDTLVHSPITSQGIQKYPKYEEWQFLSGNILVDVAASNPTLDSIYKQVRNSEHYSMKCVDCHDRIHSLTPISCLNCHDKAIPADREHSDVGCEACHDATMKPFRVIDSVFPFSSTVRAAAIRDNKVIDWRSHMIVNPMTVSPDNILNFCRLKCHNSVGEGTVGAPVDFDSIGIHD